MEQALREADKVVAYKDLSAKSAIHLRFLTEEMMGMMRSITGETDGEFWIEDQDGVYQLHLRAMTRMDPDKRSELLALASSGRNDAARGLMGRLRNFFEQSGDTPLPLFESELADYTSLSTLNWEWSLSAYQNALSKYQDTDPQAREMWDELEKSVVTHVADEIRISIRGPQVEMIILKKLL